MVLPSSPKPRSRKASRLIPVVFILLLTLLASHFLQAPVDSPPLVLGETSTQLKKTPMVRSYMNTQLRDQTPKGGGFVHMGKTGGSTLSVLLRNGCHSYMKHPCRNVMNESPASMLVESYYHVPDFRLLLQSHHDFYILTVRDPLDRIISSFVYEHYRNRVSRNETIPQAEIYQQAYECFPTLEDFANFFDGPNPKDFHYPYYQNVLATDSCRDLARAAIYGRVRKFNHFFFSYERIASFIPQQSKLFVTRQEHLWKDWLSINKLLDPSITVIVPDQEDAIRRNTTRFELQNQLPVTRKLSERGRQLLCRALESEYQTYLGLLHKAANLSPQDVNEATQEVKRKCPLIKLT